MTVWSTRIRRASMLLVPIALLALSSEARAGDAEKAQALFLEAMKLMAKKQFGEACSKLARSQELDPGMGTQFRLAECYEKLGRIASAYDQYTSVADAAKAGNKQDREALARRRAAALEAKVAKLTINIAPSVASLPGVEVTRDGVPLDKKLWGTPIPVDPGDHIVTVRAPSKKPFEDKVWAEVSSKLVVTVGSLEDTARVSEAPPPPKSHVPTIVLASAGGLGLVLGATFVGLRAAAVGSAESLNDKISADGSNCVGGGKGKNRADCASLASAASRGDAFGTASIVAFAVGGAALVGMTTYLLIPNAKAAPMAGVRFAPTFAAGETGVVAWGAF